MQTKQTLTEGNDTNILDQNKDQSIGSICVPLKMDTIVYRSHAQSSNSGYYQYAFQTKGYNRSTTLYSYTIREGIGSNDKQILHSFDLQIKVKSQISLNNT